MAERVNLEVCKLKKIILEAMVLQHEMQKLLKDFDCIAEV